MLAWRFHEPGDIANLRPEEVPDPVPGPGEALVRIHFAALNPADRYLVQGQYPRAGAPPFTPGRDAYGEVVGVGQGVECAAGQRVVLLGGATGISRQGTLAEYAAIPAEWLAPAPEDWRPEEAAAGPLVLLTAWQALVDRGGLKAGETVLVTGASGGVGTASVLLAKALGARTAALSRDTEKRTRLEALGADFTFDAGAPDLEKSVKAALGDAPPALIVENLGGPFLNRSAVMAAYGARIMVVGLLAGLKAEITVGLLIHKCLRLQGLSVSSYTPDEARNAWEGIVQTLAAAGARPPVDQVFPKTEVQEAFARLHAGPMGKVLVDFR